LSSSEQGSWGDNDLGWACREAGQSLRIKRGADDIIGSHRTIAPEGLLSEALYLDPCILPPQLLGKSTAL